MERLVRSDEGLLSQLPFLERLREACKRAREWWGRAEALQQPKNCTTWRLWKLWWAGAGLDT